MSHDRRDTYDASARPSSNFMMSGTIWSDDSDVVRGYPMGQSTPARDPACFRPSPSDTSQETDECPEDDGGEFPQNVCTPTVSCCSCARNNVSAASTSAPQLSGRWPQNSGTDACPAAKNANDNNNGYPSPPSGRDFRPFGSNDSYAAPSPLDQTTDRYSSRTRSVDRAGVCSRRSDFTYERYIS